jgi:hypothetical protein
MAEPLAAAGQAEALALLGLIARDAIPPDIDTALAYLRKRGGQRLTHGGGGAWPGLSAWAAWPAARYRARLRSFRARRRCRKPRGGGQPDRAGCKWRARRSRLARASRPAGGPGGGGHSRRGGDSGGDAGDGAGRRAGPRSRPRSWPRRSAAIRSALRLLGWMRLQGVGGAVDAPAGLAALERAAMAGNGAAATDLGLLHRDGTGVPSDPAPRATGSGARPRRGMAGAQRTWRGSWATGTTAYPTIPRTPLPSSARATPGASRRPPTALRWPIGTAIGTPLDPQAARTTMTRAAARGVSARVERPGGDGRNGGGRRPTRSARRSFTRRRHGRATRSARGTSPISC